MRCGLNCFRIRQSFEISICNNKDGIYGSKANLLVFSRKLFDDVVCAEVLGVTHLEITIHRLQQFLY